MEGWAKLGGEAARVDVANAYHVARVYSSREREKDALLTVFILGQKNGSNGSANGEVTRASMVDGRDGERKARASAGFSNFHKGASPTTTACREMFS